MKLGSRTIKTAIAAPIAMVIAQYVGLSYAVSASIITALSIQSTKKQTIEIAISRFLATIIALSIASILFLLIGFNPVAFGLYFIAFIPIAVYFKMQDSIIVCSVLVTHLLDMKIINLSGLSNELLLVTIGTTLGILSNFLFMPNTITEVTSSQKRIDDLIKLILYAFAKDLRHQQSSDLSSLFNDLKEEIKNGLLQAQRYRDNRLFDKTTAYYFHYMEMRQFQIELLILMQKRIDDHSPAREHALKVSEFTIEVADQFSENNDASNLLVQLDLLFKYFKALSLPKTRDEFESRAVLYEYLNDLEYFLGIKNQFINSIKDS